MVLMNIFLFIVIIFSFLDSYFVSVLRILQLSRIGVTDFCMSGKTALMYACESEVPETALKLIEKGASIDTVTK